MNMEIEGSKKPVAIIIMNWNGARLLEQFLPSVCGMTDSMSLLPTMAAPMTR